MSFLRNKSRIAALCVMACGMLSMPAQRVVTPVESNDLPLEVRRNAEQTTEPADTAVVTEKEPVHKASLFGGLLLTADLAAPVMTLFGQQYGSYELALEADLYHRFFPVVEVGMGYARYTPADNNYTYKCSPSVYGRVGVNYNFFYNNGSESFFALGVRYGLTGFSYSWDGISFDDGYWDSSVSASIPKQSAFAHWGELALVLRVQVYKDFYMGWSGRYRILFGCGKSSYGEPWFIPGFGVASGSFGFTYTIGYRLPIGHKNKDKK